jgi:hypothetical protein
VYLTTQSVPYVAGFLAAVLSGTGEAVRLVRSVTRAATATLSPIQEGGRLGSARRRGCP